MSKVSRTACLATLALGVAGSVIGTASMLYRDYLDDPDLLAKVQYDLGIKRPELERKHLRSPHIRNNDLYSLLIKGNLDEFKSELEKEASVFAIVYNTDRSKNPLFEINMKYQILGFADNATFLAYLKGNHAFMKASLERGFFLDSAIAALLERLEQEKIKLLLEKADIQLCHTNNPLTILDFPNMPIPEIEKHLFRDLLFRTEWELSKFDRKTALEKYGETKKMILQQAKKRYQTFQQICPYFLDENEKSHHERLLAQAE